VLPYRPASPAVYCTHVEESINRRSSIFQPVARFGIEHGDFGESFGKHLADYLQPVSCPRKIGFVRQQQCLNVLNGRIIICRRRFADEHGFDLFQPLDNGFGRERRIIVAEIDDQHAGISCPNHARDIAFHEIRRDRRHVDELHADVFIMPACGSRVVKG